MHMIITGGLTELEQIRDLRFQNLHSWRASIWLARRYREIDKSPADIHWALEMAAHHAWCVRNPLRAWRILKDRNLTL